MTIKKAAGVTITGPAVTLDVDALRAWLAERADWQDLADSINALTDNDDLELNPGGQRDALAEANEDDEPITRVDDLGFGEPFDGSTKDLLAALDSVIQGLRDDEQTAWTIANGVQGVDLIRAYDGDGGCDGAYVLVDTDGGLRFASLHHDPHQLGVEIGVSGEEAAVAAMMTIAIVANDLMRDYRLATNADAMVTGREVTILTADPRHIRGLEVDMGLRRDALNTAVFTVGGEPYGIKLDQQFDLDAAVGYARRAELLYTEVRETTYEYTPGLTR